MSRDAQIEVGGVSTDGEGVKGRGASGDEQRSDNPLYRISSIHCATTAKIRPIELEPRLFHAGLYSWRRFCQEENDFLGVDLAILLPLEPDT